MRKTVLLLGPLCLSACDQDPVVPDPAAISADAALTSVGDEHAALVTSGSEEQVITDAITYSCGTEPIRYTLTINYQWHIVSLPSGDWMNTSQFHMRNEGAGIETGMRYTGHLLVNATQVFAAPKEGAFTYTQLLRAIGVTQGAAENDAMTLTAKWTITPDGQIAVEFFDLDWQCRG